MTHNELVLTFRGSYVRANFCENRSRNATVRVPTDGQTHRQTDRHTDANRFIICPMLYAIAMGQIIMGDRAASDVGASHPDVKDVIRLPGTSSPLQEVSTVEGGQVPVREPVRIPQSFLTLLRGMW